MNDSAYTIRNYRPADFDNYLALNAEAEKLEPAGRPTSPQVLSESLHRPNYSPERDLFIVETAGNMVGYTEVAPELGIRRVILNCFVHPDHRRRGLATKLLGYALQRARELGTGVAHVNIARDNIAAQKALSRLGFRLVRRFLQLRVNMAEVRWQDIDQTALPCRQLERGEEDKLTRIQNRAFTGTWGYNPNTVAEITYRTNLVNCSPGDVILACDGDKPVGYCWTRIDCEPEDRSGEGKGHIYMLGVEPDYRQKGIGKRVLLAGLSYLKSRGRQVVELTVDSRNRAACALYRSVGFKVRTHSLWYEKVVD